MKEIAKYFLAGLIFLVLADAFTGGAVLARYQAWRAAAASGGVTGAEMRIEPGPAVIRFVEPVSAGAAGLEVMAPETAVSPTLPPAGSSKYEEAIKRVDDWASTRPVRP